MDYLEVLRSIYKPDFGSIWKAPNCIWTTGFAKNVAQSECHPAVVEYMKSDNVSVQLVPGTSVDYNKGSCVFKVDLASNGKLSYFLIKLSMPYSMSSLLKLKRGWDGIQDLSEDQKKDFLWQIKICKG